MQNVCAVFGVTRETMRKWKESLRQGGTAALLNKKKVGKRAKISSVCTKTRVWCEKFSFEACVAIKKRSLSV